MGMKKLLLKLGLVALLGAGLFVAWLWWTEPRTGICRLMADRINDGMKREEIVKLIGSEPTHEEIACGPNIYLHHAEWAGNGRKIRLQFGIHLEVVSKEYFSE